MDLFDKLKELYDSDDIEIDEDGDIVLTDDGRRQLVGLFIEGDYEFLHDHHTWIANRVRGRKTIDPLVWAWMRKAGRMLENMRNDGHPDLVEFERYVERCDLEARQECATSLRESLGSALNHA